MRLAPPARKEVPFPILPPSFRLVLREESSWEMPPRVAVPAPSATKYMRRCGSSECAWSIGFGDGVLSLMQNDMQGRCYQQNQNHYMCQTDYSGCNVTTGNSTRLSPGQAVTCESVPFRHLAHAITAYALNGSDMHIEIKGSAPDPYDPDRPVTLEVCVECLIGKQRNQFSLRSPSRAACHA
jgi:hypothetical protein